MKHVLFFLLIAGPVAAEGPSYSDLATESCLQEAVVIGERQACIGASARACMDDGGGSYVESICYSEEGVFWDARLNAVYQEQMSAARGSDPALADALLRLQRAWIGYRDARCDAVFAAWGEGTGRSPAFAECLMRTTAEQTIFLERGL